MASSAGFHINVALSSFMYFVDFILKHITILSVKGATKMNFAWLRSCLFLNFFTLMQKY